MSQRSCFLLQKFWHTLIPHWRSSWHLMPCHMALVQFCLIRCQMALSDRRLCFAQAIQCREKLLAVREGGTCLCVHSEEIHTYLYGHSFMLQTDHKPLLGLFKKQQAIPPQASARIQRWALTLTSYEYHLQFRKSKAHSNTDALGRLPLAAAPDTVPDPPEVASIADGTFRFFSSLCNRH